MTNHWNFPIQHAILIKVSRRSYHKPWEDITISSTISQVVLICSRDRSWNCNCWMNSGKWSENFYHPMTQYPYERQCFAKLQSFDELANKVKRPRVGFCGLAHETRICSLGWSEDKLNHPSFMPGRYVSVG